MVILGATAPKNNKRPLNPTGSNTVGTMVGQIAGKRGHTAAEPHRPQY